MSEYLLGNPNNQRISLPLETTKLAYPESKTEKPVTVSAYPNLHNPCVKKKKKKRQLFIYTQNSVRMTANLKLQNILNWKGPTRINKFSS